MSAGDRDSGVQLTLDALAPWLADYDVAVVETAAGTRHNNIHAPDVSSPTPRPACADRGGVLTEKGWIPKELTGGLAAFRERCTCEECFERLDELADRAGVEFDE